jgi:hypothetical protein
MQRRQFLSDYNVQNIFSFCSCMRIKTLPVYMLSKKGPSQPRKGPFWSDRLLMEQPDSGMQEIAMTAF